MPMNESSNRNGTVRELALKARDGNTEALEKLLVDQEIKKVIYKIANEKVGQVNAEDVYQEVLACISQKIHTWQGHAEITTWTGRITRNICIDFLRKTKPNWLMITDTTPEESVEPEQLQRTSAREMIEIAERTLLNMGKECQQLLRSYIVEGLEKKEIMGIVKLPKSTFHRRWKMCYNTLIEKIQQFCEFPGKNRED
jgi:RNA polymerase sigma factor (sigma-70 family)